jgi:putative oxidoreductase
MGFLKPYAEPIYAALRIFAGLMFMAHGLQKIFGLFGGVPAEAPAFIVWGAGTIELVTGALIAVGLLTGPAAFLASGTMAAAFFLGHVFSPQNPTRNLLPIVNRGELAVLYCWVFLFIATKGSGIWSVDAARGKSLAPSAA